MENTNTTVICGTCGGATESVIVSDGAWGDPDAVRNSWRCVFNPLHEVLPTVSLSDLESVETIDDLIPLVALSSGEVLRRYLDKSLRGKGVKKLVFSACP